MRNGWRETTLGEVLTLARRVATVSPDAEYKFVTLPVNGVGARLRKVVRGSDVGSAKYLVRQGDLMISKIDARKGSNSLLPRELDGAIVTGDFLSYEVDQSQVDLDYLDVTVRRAEFAELCDTVSSGTTNRVRLDPKRFLKLSIILPPLDEQRRIVDLIAAVDDAVEAAEAEVRETEALVEATRDLRIWYADVGLTPLSKVARVVGGLVAPVGDAAMLPHIGTDRIESVTGRLVGVQTAAEDQVTSGKFLHESDTVIYSKIRPNLRKVAIPSWRGLCSADAYPMLPMGEGNISFLRHLLVSRPFTDAAVARSGRTKMPKINRTELMSIEVPDIEPDEQASIAADLDSMRDAADAARATAESLRTLRSNLLTVLLSGEHEIPSSYDALLGEVA